MFFVMEERGTYIFIEPFVNSLLGPGSSSASASQSSQANTTPSNNVSQHQARIQAAAAAAAVYQKSFVYPSVPTLAWY